MKDTKEFKCDRHLSDRLLSVERFRVGDVRWFDAAEVSPVRTSRVRRGRSLLSERVTFLSSRVNVSERRFRSPVLCLLNGDDEEVRSNGSCRWVYLYRFVGVDSMDYRRLLLLETWT